ncbi:helix-turn-helix transcriptional regulator [Bacillus sp. FJAT-49732]|uniref:Helix-turn-helix transcriptional regulator n=1 Tax=Lederbergia citrisecunda TaxID=2833583 RepID=A0A942YM95_9BACI|nr:AraC family transcriptional regulator [Lederbergia citrisecunda]MBS4200465.1 helix-turn-helix transcriptional regulator [Lederbergia citrisecunda]
MEFINSSINTHSHKWDMGFHKHQTYEISILLEGNAVFQLENAEFFLQEGSVVIIPPNLPHRIFAITSVRWGVIEITVMPKELKKLFYRLTHTEYPRIISLLQIYREQYEVLFRNWLKMISQPLIEEKKVIFTWIEIFLLFLLQHSKTGYVPITIETTATYIRSNLHQEIRMRDLAILTGFSESNFRRKFKELYGINPKQFQQYYRMAEAKWLLVYTKKSLQIISEQIGFSNIHSFSSWFKQIEGLSPSEWRKNKGELVF